MRYHHTFPVLTFAYATCHASCTVYSEMPIVGRYSTQGSLTQIFYDFFSPPNEQQFGVLASRLPQLISGPGALVTLVFYLQFANPQW